MPKRATSTTKTTGRMASRSAKSGRFVVTASQARSAARTKVAVDEKLGRETSARIKKLASEA